MSLIKVDCSMSKGKKQGITWFEPFTEKETSGNEGSGLIKRFLKRPQRATVKIDEQKQSVKFEKSVVDGRTSSTSEVESTGGESTDATVYSSPPRTLSTVINRLDNLGRSKVPLINDNYCHKHKRENSLTIITRLEIRAIIMCVASYGCCHVTTRGCHMSRLKMLIVWPVLCVRYV